MSRRSDRSPSPPPRCRSRWPPRCCSARGAAAPPPAERPEESPASLHLEVDGATTASNVDLHLSSGWFGALISTASIDCDGDADGDARRMMESLREQGEGGVWKDRDRDGDDVLARRAKGMLKIETTETRATAPTSRCPGRSPSA